MGNGGAGSLPFSVGPFSYITAICISAAFGAVSASVLLSGNCCSRLYRKGSWTCIAGIIQAILLLVVFKYSHFFVSLWQDLAPGARISQPNFLAGLFLPLGLSFFTFEFIHFAVDTYQGKIERAPASHYAAFIFFFPSMVAGPLKRYQGFHEKLEKASFEPAIFVRGITRILVGLFKKHVLADTFTLWSDQLATSAALHSPAISLVGWIFAYGMKIYFDFSGYSDVAIGSGYLLGIQLPENFDWPYLSKNVSEFWRRWHISLSQWIRDYIYVPLGGSRKGEVSASVNLMIAFGVSGLWHGANYNFVAWGLWHGLLMVIHRAWRTYSPRMGIRLPAAAAIALTFISVNIGWGLFCVDIARARIVFARIFTQLL